MSLSSPVKPGNVHEQRERLIKCMQKIGFGETAEAIAYTWFNRFAALRYMAIHDYLGHGHPLAGWQMSAPGFKSRLE